VWSRHRREVRFSPHGPPALIRPTARPRGPWCPLTCPARSSLLPHNVLQPGSGCGYCIHDSGPDTGGPGSLRPLQRSMAAVWATLVDDICTPRQCLPARAAMAACGRRIGCHARSRHSSVRVPFSAPQFPGRGGRGYDRSAAYRAIMGFFLGAMLRLLFLAISEPALPVSRAGKIHALRFARMCSRALPGRLPLFFFPSVRPHGNRQPWPKWTGQTAALQVGGQDDYDKRDGGASVRRPGRRFARRTNKTEPGRSSIVYPQPTPSWESEAAPRPISFDSTHEGGCGSPADGAASFDSGGSSRPVTKARLSLPRVVILQEPLCSQNRKLVALVSPHGLANGWSAS